MRLGEGPIEAWARCTCGPFQPFVSSTVVRRALGPRDVLIDVAFCGICHSDIQYARDGMAKTSFPLVPGHEIAGHVAAVGGDVGTFKVGDRVGVGCFVDSCRACASCRDGEEQYCAGHRTLTYNSRDRDGRITYGGYCEKIVVDEDFVIPIPDAIPLAQAAPMFCAGITLYSPLRHWKAGPDKRVGIVGFGGLGHLGLQFSRALGAETTVFDLSPDKRTDAIRLGAVDFRLPDALADLAGAFDLILSTVPGSLDLDRYLALLARDGTLVTTGVPKEPFRIQPRSLLDNRRSIAGTRSGGIRETREMIEFAAASGIAAEVEIIGADEIDTAYERVRRGDVRFRFVIDIATMKQSARTGETP